MDRQHIIVTIIFCLASATGAIAQNSAELYRKPAQVTFITPIGTNGKTSSQTINNFSLNFIIGTSAGVEGLEIGNMFNHTNGLVSGVQLAGLGNYTTQKVRGCQIAGLFNTSATFYGLQVAGLVTINTGRNRPFPQDYSNGVQLSGITNINATPTGGMQIAGVANLHSAYFRGVQLAGVVNESQDVIGAQVAGVLNKAKTLSGAQIGLINIADSIKDGVQIGLLNFSKNGYHAFEVEVNESFYLGLTYKMGTDHLYTILSLAYTERDGKRFWAPGQGLGTMFTLSQKANLNIDAIHYWVNEAEWWTSETNMLEKLKINASYQLTPGVSLYGGASLNVQISKIKNVEGEPVGSKLRTPDSFYDEVHKNTRIIIYPGLNAGLRF